MKKLFALIMVVAMLTVAGAAMAADTTLTTSEAKLSMVAGTTKTITLTATAGHGGTLSPITVSGATWATISGNTLTLAPTAVGNYTLNTSVTETYTVPVTVENPGHSTPTTETVTATATAPITVSVVAASTGTVIITRVVEVVKTVTRTVTVISRTAQRAAVVQTFTETVRTVTQSITVAVLTKVEGFTTALAQVWTAKATEVETKRSTTVTAIANDTARANQVFKFSNPSLTRTLTPRPNTSLVAATSTTRSTMTVTEKLGVATAQLGVENAKALSVQEAVKATESGTYSFVKTFGKTLYGTRINGHRGQRAKNLQVSSFSAAAVDNEGVAFVNSSGDVVDTIPGDEHSQDIMPGYVVMLVVMEAGETYEPVVYATSEDLATAGVSVDTTPTTVSVDEVSEKEETVIVTVNPDGSVEETVVTVDEDDPEVQAAESAMATAMGATSIKAVPITAYSAAVSASAMEADDALAASRNLHIAARLGFVVSSLSDDTYYMPMTFRALPSGRSLASGAAFSFYPDGLADGTVAYSKVFYTDGTEVTDPASILNDEVYYVAFEVLDGGIRVSNTDYSLENPTMTIPMASTTPVSPDVKPDVSPDVKPDVSPDVSPDVPDPKGIGGSSGGCTAGSAALALALLGTFIATRKK